MKARGSFVIYSIAAFLAIGSPAPHAHAQCYGPLELAPEFFEFDYLVRLAVHFGAAEDIPRGIICSRARLPGEEVVEVPIWFYNAHEGITSLEFAIESNDTLLDLIPDNGWYVHDKSYHKCDASIYQLNVKMIAYEPVCGPGLAGRALVEPAPGSDPTWIALVPNRNTGRMHATGAFNDDHNLFSPHYGGSVGSKWLYTCQEPICPEPNAAVTGFVAQSSYGEWVRLRWTDGSGNTTVIRARVDRYPAGYDDGRLVVEMPGSPGAQQVFYDTGIPLSEIVFYKAFSLTKNAGGAVLSNSFVECAALDTVMTTSVIGAEPSSWGRIKNAYRQ